MNPIAQLFTILQSLLFLCSLLGDICMPVNGEKTWCVAKPSSSEEELEGNKEYACSQRGVDCGPIGPGGSCFSPNTKAQHASFAMNSYYHTYGSQPHTCSFKDSALVAASDPSRGSCNYTAGDSHGPIKQLRKWCVAKAGTDEVTLRAIIAFVCTRLDCTDIEEGNACFSPNTLWNHASFAMNLFFHTLGQSQDGDFRNSGLLVITDPSYGICRYSSGTL